MNNDIFLFPSFSINLITFIISSLVELPVSNWIFLSL